MVYENITNNFYNNTFGYFDMPSNQWAFQSFMTPVNIFSLFDISNYVNINSYDYNNFSNNSIFNSAYNYAPANNLVQNWNPNSCSLYDLFQSILNPKPQQVQIEALQQGERTNYDASKGKEIISYAQKFIGKNEKDGSADMFWRGIGRPDLSSKEYGWCAAYVSYVLTKCGIDMSGANMNSPAGLRQWGEEKGTLISGNEANSNNVKPGDVAIWLQGSHYPNHTGFVTEVFKDGTYNTIEGNFADTVCERKGEGSTGEYKMNETTGFIQIA